jgi:hypothetical protein
MALVQALPQEFAQRIGPAVAQRAKNLAPIVWNATKQGFKEGAKAGVKSLLRPSAKSKYLSFNNIGSLANPPDGNIQAEINANLEEAKARSDSPTPFLNAIIGEKRRRGIQNTLRTSSRSPSPSPPRGYLGPVGIQGWQFSKEASKFKNLAQSRSPSPISIRNPNLLTPEQLSSIQEKIKAGQLPASALKNIENLTNENKEELERFGLPGAKMRKTNENLSGGRRRTRRRGRRALSRSRSSRRRH